MSELSLSSTSPLYGRRTRDSLLEGLTFRDARRFVSYPFADALKTYLMSYTAFPKEHAKRIRTTNMMERVNKELKRRTKVAEAFPDEESLLRFAGSILMDINEEWVTGRRYLVMERE